MSNASRVTPHESNGQYQSCQPIPYQPPQDLHTLHGRRCGNTDPLSGRLLCLTPRGALRQLVLSVQLYPSAFDMSLNRVTLSTCSAMASWQRVSIEGRFFPFSRLASDFSEIHPLGRRFSCSTLSMKPLRDRGKSVRSAR